MHNNSNNNSSRPRQRVDLEVDSVVQSVRALVVEEIRNLYPRRKEEN